MERGHTVMILVTGGTGQLGGAVVRHLLDEVPADQIAVSVRDPRRALQLAARGVTVRAGDFDDPSTLASTFDGIERLLLVSTNGPHHTRLAQHTTAVRAAAKAGVGHLVYTSILSTAPPVIRQLQRETEHVIAESGIAHTFLRHPLYAENYTVALPSALDDGVLVTATGAGSVAAAARDDLALAAAAVLLDEGHRGRAYELTGPRAWTMDELAATAAQLSGRPLEHRAVSSEELAEHRRAAGQSDAAIAVVVGIQEAIRAGAFATVTTDLEHLIGQPPTPIETSVQAALQ